MEKVDKQVFTAGSANNLRFRVFRQDKWDGSRMVRFGMIGDNIVQALDAQQIQVIKQYFQHFMVNSVN